MHAEIAAAWEGWTDGGKIRWVQVATSRIRSGANQMECWEAAVRAAVSLERVGRNADARQWLMLLDSIKRDPHSELFKELRFPLAFCRTKVAHSCDTERIRRDLLEQSTRRVRHPRQHHKVSLLEVQIRRREGKIRSALAGALSASATAKVDHPIIALRLLLEALRCRYQLEQYDEAIRGLDTANQLLERVRSPLLHVEVKLARCELLLGLGRTGRVVALAQESRQKSQSLYFPYGIALADLAEANALQALGDRRTAQKLARNAHSKFLALGHPERRAESSLLLAELALGNGEARGAALLAEEALMASKKLFLPLVHARAQDLLLTIAGATGDTKVGTDRLQRRQSTKELPFSKATAETQWYRWQNDLEGAKKACLLSGKRGYSAARSLLELARTHLQHGNIEECGSSLQKGRAIADKEGFEELKKYARLIEGALLPKASFPGWEELITDCISESWMELFLGALEFDARRKMHQNQNTTARSQLEALRMRSEDLGFLPYTESATALIQQLG